MSVKEPWTTRIYTPNGFVQENILNEAKALDLGCGNRKLPGAVGADCLALPAVDVVHDLAAFPWPFRDNEYDLVFANHFMEHADDVLQTLGEIHRILAPGGRIVMQVPYFRAVDAFTDPTHRHYYTSSTLDYVTEGSGLAAYSYTPFTFKRIGLWHGWPHPSRNPLVRMFKKWLLSDLARYDQYLSLLFPVQCLTWELEVTK
ncbi:MAG: hypothetical protein JWL88_414 [Parcubacteria group bacterium]|nr:hypothetical protein [Parcubacteria group bacterium]